MTLKHFKLTHIVKHLRHVLFLSGLCTLSVQAYEIPTDITPVKNVIILIPDGMAVGSTTLARIYNEHYNQQTLTLPSLMTGMMNTWDAAGKITDSAAAGTALATGWKTKSGLVGMTGNENTDYLSDGVTKPSDNGLISNMPIATLAEAAALNGKATGIVSTSEFMHATPAAFTAHDLSRNSYDNITEQIIHNHLDVILGGGMRYIFDPSSRSDGENMKTAAEEQGFTLVSNPTALANFTGERLLGVFGANQNASAMSNDIDRDPSLEPSLADMTEKAISVLNKNENGFFLMVEGSKIDWAAHANDPVALVSEISAFDKAVEVALKFAKDNEDTLIIAVTDHGNSGLSIGDRSISTGYDTTPYTTFIEPIHNAKMTVEGVQTQLAQISSEQGSVSEQALFTLLQTQLGLNDLSTDEVKTIATTLQNSPSDVNVQIASLVSKRAKIGFAYTSHTGEDVVLYTYDPRGIHLAGMIDNTDVAKFAAASLGVDLLKATQTLFIDAQVAFNAKGADTTVNLSDATNPKLEVVKGNNSIVIEQNKNYVLFNGSKIVSPGVNVYQNGKWFVSENIIGLIN